MHLELDQESLKPLIKLCLEEVLAELKQANQQVPSDRLAYSEAEAARLLGLEQHQLRDERRRGRITASIVVGRRVRYRPEDLHRYLGDRRVEATKA